MVSIAEPLACGQRGGRQAHVDGLGSSCRMCHTVRLPAAAGQCTSLRPSLIIRHAGRDIKSVAGVVGGLPVRVATSHLESATGWQADQQNSAQRVAQLKQAAALLDRAPEPDVLLAGDMVSG